MEHKLIQGGESFLPFARSRIKALKATGLKYASQKFEVDGVSIRVRIAGEHEYIELEGEPVDVFSGIVKTGDIVELPAPSGSPPGTPPVNVLRSFRPTQNCWDIPLKKDPQVPVGASSDARQLAYAPDVTKKPDAVAAQIRDIKPSMFSGEMATVVQILLGRKVPVLYKMSFNTSHGVVRGADGEPWLVEVSKTRGVLATPFSVTKVKAKDKNDAVREAAELFGGVPTGKTFPKTADLEAAITGKKVLRLLTADDLLPLMDKTPHSPLMGCTFGQKDAYNTCWFPDAGENTSYLYKLAFAFGPKKDMSGSCTLSLESQGLLSALIGDVCMVFYESPSFYSSTPTGTTMFYVERSAPVLARHVGGVLDVVSVRTQPTTITETVSGNPKPWRRTTPETSFASTTVTKNVQQLRFIASPLIGENAGGNISTVREDNVFSGYSVLFGNGGGTESVGWNDSRDSVVERAPTFRRGVWNPGERDGLLVIEGPSSSGGSGYEFRYKPISTNPYTWYSRPVFPGIYVEAITVDGQARWRTAARTGAPSAIATFSQPLQAGRVFESFAGAAAYVSSVSIDNGAEVDGVYYPFPDWGGTSYNLPDVAMPRGRSVYHHSSGALTEYVYPVAGTINSNSTFQSIRDNSPFITACSMFGPDKCRYTVDLTSGLFPDGNNTFHDLRGALYSNELTPTDEEFNFTGFLSL